MVETYGRPMCNKGLTILYISPRPALTSHLVDRIPKLVEFLGRLLETLSSGSRRSFSCRYRDAAMLKAYILVCISRRFVCLASPPRSGLLS